MTKEEQEWYNSHNQNELMIGFCKWAKPFTDSRGNHAYYCTNKEASKRWGLEFAPICAEPWLKCNLKQPGIFGIDKDKIDISSVIYSSSNKEPFQIEKQKEKKFNYRNFWLIISMIAFVYLMYKIL